MAASPPYPQSPVISQLTWAPASEIIRDAPGKRFPNGRYDGSDNWPITWADDGHLYTAYGDGHGFDPLAPEKLGLGFARILGDPPDFKGENIRSDGENTGFGRKGMKASGLLMVGGVLYMWARNADGNGRHSRLAWSEDCAKTWAWCGWKFEEFGYPTFINFGRNYTGARDGYVYTVSHDGPDAYVPADRFVLMRVPGRRIGDRAAWEFFRAPGANGEPEWTPDIDKRGAVFEFPGQCLRSGISFNAPLGRYFWWQVNGADKEAGDTRFEGGFGVYDAPEPWGPWTTAYFTEKWDVGPGEAAGFPPKWMGEGGRTLYLVFSGNDNFAVRKATLSVKA